MANQIQNIYDSSYSTRISYTQEDSILFRIGKAKTDASKLQSQLANISDANSTDYQSLQEKLNATLSEYSKARQAYIDISSKNKKTSSQKADEKNAKTASSFFANNKAAVTDENIKEQIQKTNQVYNFQGRAILLNSYDYLNTGTNLNIAV